MIAGAAGPISLLTKYDRFSMTIAQFEDRICFYYYDIECCVYNIEEVTMTSILTATLSHVLNILHMQYSLYMLLVNPAL